MATPIPVNQAAVPRAWLERLAGAELNEIAESLRGVRTDSRGVTADSVYIALRGERFDGHDYVAAALAAGAGCAVVARDAVLELPTARLCRVEDPLRALGQLALWHRRRWREQGGAALVAITGSAGKTTTKELTAALLRARAETLATAGNLNNRIGLPSTALCLQQERFAVLEAGMSLPGEMAELACIAEPDIAVLLNVGHAHAEGVGGPEGIAREKGALLAGLARAGTAIVNADDALAMHASARAPQGTKVRTFGEHPTADYRLLERKLAPDGGSWLRVRRGPESLELRSPLDGHAQALDLLAALAAADDACARAGLAPLQAECIERALADVHLPGRGSRHPLRGGGVLIDDSYNANPESMNRALGVLAEMAAGRRQVLVLGEMRELGSYERSAHEQLGERIAARPPALVIGCGGAIEHTLRRAADAGVVVLAAATTEDAVLLARRHVLPEDAVLVKASRGVRAEQVVAALLAQYGA